MARRASTGYSFIVGVDKPAGMTSHDVVNRVRRIYGERRCGHMGTLDPAATGALAVAVGPATRLDAMLTAHDKAYEFTIAFGSATDTDDAEGEVIKTGPVPARLADAAFARDFVEGLVGKAKQMPPVYSAIKVNGKKACDEARRGRIIDLAPRDIEIYESRLVAVEGDREEPVWRVRMRVSAGTYVRAIARDAGVALQTCAHVGELRRLQAGRLSVRDCVSLEDLESHPFDALLDPVKLLGLRFAFADDGMAKPVGAGNPVAARGLALHRYVSHAMGPSCAGGAVRSMEPLEDGEKVCIVVDNALAAVYRYEGESGMLKSCCGFSIGVKRGPGI